MAQSYPGPFSSEDILYVLNHVFLPPKLPQEEDIEADSHDIALSCLVHQASVDFTGFLSKSQQEQWSVVTQMLHTLLETTQSLSEIALVKNILDLKDGGVLVLRIRAQNAALIMRSYRNSMIFETFEVSPTPEAVMEVDGRLICSYPGPAVQIPLDVAQNPLFVEELASFLVQMDVDQLDAPTTTKAGSKVTETRSTTHPHYITQLLTMILYGMGKEAQINRITKRVADDVCCLSVKDPWRRSPLWLVIRVAIQTTIDSRRIYKEFMVFFQTRLLKLFLRHNFSSEQLYVSRIKTSRRVYKLGNSASPRLLEVVRDVGEEIEQRLRARWPEEHTQSIFPNYTFDASAFKNDTTMSLLKSRDYLTEVMLPKRHTQSPAAFIPRHIPRISEDQDFHDLCRDGLKLDSDVALADFEFLVQSRLDSWVPNNLKDVSACNTLGSCLERYISFADKEYTSIPEAQSVMLLTILELWVALDTIACVQCPLLSSYSPEIPASVLDPLLLRREKCIQRATRIQQYLHRRHSTVTCTTSVYSYHLDHTTFAVRYFQDSPSLQDIKACIETKATATREKKVAELERLNAESRSLSQQIENLSCDYVDNGRGHFFRCRKCLLKSRLNKMSIDVHEWPLPTHQLEGEAVVFELQCPPVFAVWRERTYQILRDLGMRHLQHITSTRYLLDKYKGLEDWSKQNTSGRITFASETKSFFDRTVSIPTTTDKVCVNNGLRFRLYDRKKSEDLSSPLSNVNFDSYGTLRLPEGAYSYLQHAVGYTTHSHNKTIVDQGACPLNLSLHEHLAFSNVRCGPRLQWMNIVRELSANNLTFSREEVHTLIMQAAWQIGPLADDLSREWHVELGISEFGLVLVREAMDLVSRVKANWMEATTIKSIIYLVSRLLTSVADGQRKVRRNGYNLLRKCRNIMYKWMRQIMEKLQNADDDTEIRHLQRQACEVAATCRATFDVDPGTHLDALLQTPADVAILIECAIIIHDNKAAHPENKSTDHEKLLHRDRRLSHFLQSTLDKLIDGDQTGLDKAIRSVWSGFRRGEQKWTEVPNSKNWLTSFTVSEVGPTVQAVHYNLLDGGLLVDGKPLGRLPREIIEDPIYRRIFDKKVLNVIPANQPGMDYMTPSEIYNYKVFFTKRDSHLIIRAQNSTGQILELIPHDFFLIDFPNLFVTEYAHWMDINSGQVEFRPLDQIWKSSLQNWRLYFLPDSNGFSRMTQGNHCLVDNRSGTFKRIADRIRNLEYPEFMTIVYDRAQRISPILIDLPRYRLSFFLNENKLESKNMDGMIIDDDQNTGTMIGLNNQLVLRHKDTEFAKLPRSRCVLIPYGNVQYSLSSDRNHVRVHIDTRLERQVTWYKFEIDSDLGLLAGSVNLTSRLYRIYLHALCSHPLPDPLTNQTGTDHALEELKAAGTFSFRKLTKTDVELLRLIGNITPCRRYYPAHLRVMQTTVWSLGLPALSQHGSFEPAVRSVLEYARSLTIFPDLKCEGDLNYNRESNAFLMLRASRRNDVYYEGGIHRSLGGDERYKSRDSPDYDAGDIVMKTSHLVFAWPVGLTRRLGSSELHSTFKSWGNMTGVIAGAISLKYSKEWLNVDLSKKWLSIYDLCRRVSSTKVKFELVFSLSALAHSRPDLWELIPVFVAFATLDNSLLHDPPPYTSYNLADGFFPDEKRVRRIISSRESRTSDRCLQSDSESTHIQRRLDYAVTCLMDQSHPSQSPFCLQSPFNQSDLEWLEESDRVMDDVTGYFESCLRNQELQSFTSNITNVLESACIQPDTPSFRFVPQLDINHHDSQYSPLAFVSLLSSRTNAFSTQSDYKFGTGLESINTDDLTKLISKFNLHDGNARLIQRYAQRLEASRRELHNQQTSTLPHSLTDDQSDVCLAYRDQCRQRLHVILSTICESLGPSSIVDHILATAGLWPRIHPRAIFHCLASSSNTPDTCWANIFATFALAFIEYQFSQRLVTYILRSEHDNFFKELDNAAFDWSDKIGNTDWLLVQIQGNFMTRSLQSKVAQEMISPSSGRNTVLQLNMGEGKSSVIVPHVAVALADSHKLVRIVVLDALTDQMFRLLVERISGLTNRRVFYLPFSRDVKMDLPQIRLIHNLFKECVRVRGVLVTQPKHILSFQLMTIDRILSSGSHLDNVAKELQAVQSWVTLTSRDVLDESDELLHVRYQLIYTMDEQRPLDYAPDRWIITQNIFDLIRNHSKKLHMEYPEEVELVDRGAACFPHFRLLGNSASQKLVSQIARDALDGRLENLTFVGLGTQPLLHESVMHFITGYNLDKQTYAHVKDTYSRSGMWKGILLLRGLLAHDILVHVLSRLRWRVDYGLDPKRSLLAVPYRAKDVPSLRSDFGHPDVAVCLTCLSYYYGGLTPEQVRECFDLLFMLDNPGLEYEKWVNRDNDIPTSFRQLIGVNTKDLQTFTKDVVPMFQHNQATVDFFLTQVVFPKEAKEFPFKLGTSGWDLAKDKANVTTGFSGTNDNADVLPTSVSQKDPVNQLRINAQVLGYLLRPENDRYICTHHERSKEFLQKLAYEHKDVRVLLDVGAQMLEMTNKQLIEYWLLETSTEKVAAGVFFDDVDTLLVISRDGVVESFYSSPFNQRLHECIIYLDDAHTRGTDIKFPPHFRAMVTLGPKVTKDRLVQGCMRMRKLGQGQSVIFCAPPDIDRRIRKTEKIADTDSVQVIDILSWVMSNTCNDIEHHIPHWVQQGVDYHQRQAAEQAFLASEGDIEILRNAWRQPAARSLDYMYSPLTNSTVTTDIPSMQNRLYELGITTVRDVRMEEEQEREVSQELDQERQIARFARIEPAEHHLDPQVHSFIRQGAILTKSSKIFLPLMTPLGSEFDLIAPRHPWLRRPQILCTRDFITTTQTGKEKSAVTDHLRPVNWIISHKLQDGTFIFVVMSPYEVNHLLPDIRKSKHVRLHMYTPRTTLAMKTDDDLAFYCVPPFWSGISEVPFDIQCQLNLWAGQLYLDGYDTYVDLCLLLGISNSENAGYTSVEIDRFVPEEGRKNKMVHECLFDKSPIAMLNTLFASRRKGMSYQRTHMGKMLHARLLLREDFESAEEIEEL